MSVIDRSVSELSPWIVRTARVGFAAKGLVYIIVGFLAVLAGAGRGGATTGSKGALGSLTDEPFGKVLLWVIAIGLFGYMVWRVIDAVKDATGRGDDAKGIARRIVTAAKGVTYGLLGMQAIRIAGRGVSGSDESSAQQGTATLMAAPFGRTLVAILGIGIIIYGVYQLYNAGRSKLSDQLSLQSLGPETQRWVVNISRFGIGARGVVFWIIGGFLAWAAWLHDPTEAQGVEGALDFVSTKPFGHALLVVIGAGLVAYGIYELVNARYRRMRV